MSIKCILFDADGVIVDSELFSIQYQREYGIPEQEMLPFFEQEFPDCLLGRADLAEEVSPWLSKWKWTGTTEEFLEYWFRSSRSVDERVVTTIEQLKKQGIKCCLATNQEKYRAQYMKSDMGFEQLFDRVFTSSGIGHKKPAKEFYQFILQEMKREHRIDPEEVVFFDDFEENVQAAKQSGINAYLYKEFADLKKITDPLFEGRAGN